MNYGKNTIVAAAAMILIAPTAFAQEDGGFPAIPDLRPITRDYRPTWGVIPPVRSPSFSYREVSTASLIAEASENLNFLPNDELIIGNTRGYQVVGPDGETFFLSNIDNPRCAVRIEGTRIVVDANNPFAPTPAPGQNSVVIGEINFDACR